MKLSERLLILIAVGCFVGAAVIWGRLVWSDRTSVAPSTVIESVKNQNLLALHGEVEIERTSALENTVNEGHKTDSQDKEFSADVRWFLSSENSDLAQLFRSGDSGAIHRAKGAAKELLFELVPCLLKPEECPYTPKDNEEYFYMGGPPVYQALDRALDFFELALDNKFDYLQEIPRETLLLAMQLPQRSVSYKAATVGLLASRNTLEKVQIIQEAKVLGPVARSMFLQYTAGQKSDRQTDPAFASAFRVAVEDSVKADSFTRSEVIVALDQLDLDENTFRSVAVMSCQAVQSREGRASMRAVLLRKAKASGFQLSASQLCESPNMSEGS